MRSSAGGVPASALHFYERKGLISSERDGAHQRIFPRHMLRRISLIIVAKRLHIPYRTSPRSSRASPPTAPPPTRTGSESPDAGRSSRRNAAASSKASNRSSPAASAAAACR
ncbi:MerR family transcriptional regulator [Streptosporangium sandarakinum]|uniref:MerR family transcriptional regulator n=1 Tax=Streptosporangium sandarakinum TaxID=1260955 RepID=UPI0033AB0082